MNKNEMIAKFVADSENMKISPKHHKVSATYVSIKASCPNTCVLRNEQTCYAMSGPIGIIMNALDKNSHLYDSNQAAEQEAKLVYESFSRKQIPQDGAKGGRDLRLHVFGDATTPFAAQVLGKVATDWKSRSGGSVWSYTHAWKMVHRNNWGADVSVLASLDNISEVRLARENGYAPAIVVAEHKNNKTYVENNVKWIPCLAQTTDLKCTECRLCFKADELYSKNMGIAFASHGSRKNKIKKRLNVL